MGWFGAEFGFLGVNLGVIWVIFGVNLGDFGVIWVIFGVKLEDFGGDLG